MEEVSGTAVVELRFSMPFKLKVHDSTTLDMAGNEARELAIEQLKHALVGTPITEIDGRIVRLSLEW
jgi:hypothetical protein